MNIHLMTPAVASKYMNIHLMTSAVASKYMNIRLVTSPVSSIHLSFPPDEYSYMIDQHDVESYKCVLGSSPPVSALILYMYVYVCCNAVPFSETAL